VHEAVLAGEDFDEASEFFNRDDLAAIDFATSISAIMLSTASRAIFMPSAETNKSSPNRHLRC